LCWDLLQAKTFSYWLLILKAQKIAFLKQIYSGLILQPRLFTWSTNLGPNLVASYNGDDGPEDKFFKTYVDGYNMVVAGHPTQNNTIFVGGVYLYRSTDGFTTRNNNLLMGGSDFNDPSTTYNDPEGFRT
jgi:hypothetical protein